MQKRFGVAAQVACFLCACGNSASPVSTAPGSGASPVTGTAAIGGSTAGSGLAGSVAVAAGSAGKSGSGGAGASAPAVTARAGTGGAAAAGTSGSAGSTVLVSAGAGGLAAGGGGASAGTGAAVGGGTCDGQNLLAVPDDPRMRGPWDVGVKTVMIGRTTVEVMYPAQAGSSAGMPEATYDLRDWLPPQERSKVPADHSPPVGPIGGHFYRDVPIDGDHGPYPIVIFIHGTASMRIASISTNVQWASRGFVVLAADYPGLGLLDQLNSACGYPTTGDQDIQGDVQAQLTALASPSGDLAMLAGHVDTTRVGISGHSQGACVSATLSTLTGVQIVLPLAGATNVSAAPGLKSIFWLAGMSDMVIGYDSVMLGSSVCPANPGPATDDVDAYTASPGSPSVTKRLVGITGGGHLVPTDLCQKNMQGFNAIQESEMDGVCGIDTAVIIGLPALFDCGTIDWMAGVDATNYGTTAALEETLQCRDRTAQFANMQMMVPIIGDYRHDP
jgi:hypothetical protein